MTGKPAAEPLDTCIRCGDDTLRAEKRSRNRHSIDISDHPRGEKWNSMWGCLCPKCWRKVWMYVAGKEPEKYDEEVREVDADVVVQPDYRRKVDGGTQLELGHEGD